MEKINKLCEIEEQKMGKMTFVNCRACNSYNKTSDGYCSDCLDE